MPLVVGEERAAIRLCQEAIERGVFAQAIRPPTVAGGNLPAAPGGHGLAHARGAADGGGGARRGRARYRAGPGGNRAATPEREIAAPERYSPRRRSSRSFPNSSRMPRSPRSRPNSMLGASAWRGREVTGTERVRRRTHVEAPAPRVAHGSVGPATSRAPRSTSSARPRSLARPSRAPPAPACEGCSSPAPTPVSARRS